MYYPTLFVGSSWKFFRVIYRMSYLTFELINFIWIYFLIGGKPVLFYGGIKIICTDAIIEQTMSEGHEQ